MPSLPPSFHETLDRGLEELRLALGSAARGAIDGHVRLLLAWNASINLTAVRDPAQVATTHVLDSLSAAPVLRRGEHGSLLDLGSGGGFPGLPLAVALDAGEALLVDSIGKKVRFLGTVVEALGVADRVSARQARAEDLARGSDRGRWPVVTARAVADLGDLVELAFPLLTVGGRLVAWKRGALAEELRRAEAAIAAVGGGRIDVVDVALSALPAHRLVIATKTGSTPERFPRDPRSRGRSPW